MSGFTLLVMTDQAATAGVVEAIAQASVEGIAEMLRAGGWCPPPTVHMLSRHLASPYLGSVATRPFYRGEDAAAAVVALGRSPSLLCATQLVLHGEPAHAHRDEASDPVLKSLKDLEDEIADLRARVVQIERQLADGDARP